MTKDKALELVKNRLGGVIIRCDEDDPGKSFQITVKPSKYLVTDTLTPEGDIRIWEVDFERKELTVIVSTPSNLVYE